jgi:hypothetical protein
MKVNKNITVESVFKNYKNTIHLSAVEETEAVFF